LGGVGNIVHGEDASADGVTNDLHSGVIGRESGSPSVWAENQLGIAVIIDSTNKRLIGVDVVRDSSAFGLAEGTSSTVGVRGGGTRRSLSSPVVIPVAVQVNTIRTTSVSSPVLSPQAVGTSGP